MDTTGSVPEIGKDFFFSSRENSPLNNPLFIFFDNPDTANPAKRPLKRSHRVDLIVAQFAVVFFLSEDFQMRIAGVAAFLILALVAGASLGAVAKFGLGYDIEAQPSRRE
jgi:hypothetical protein